MPSVSNCNRAAPTHYPNKSVSTFVRNSELNQARTSSIKKTCLSFQKAFLASQVYQKAQSLCVSLVSSLAKSKYDSINFQQKLANPRKLRTPLVVVGDCQSLIALTFSGSIQMPFPALTTYPRYFTLSTSNSHLLMLHYRPAVQSCLRTCSTCF